MTALRRVLRSPGLIAGVWLVYLAVAGVFGFILHAAAIGASDPYTALPDGHHLFHLGELLEAEKSIVVMGLGGALAAAVSSVVAWTLLSPFIIARLAGRSLSEVGEVGLRSLPAVAVQTLWHGALRVVVLFAALMIAAPAPGAIKLLLLSLAFGGSAIALDVVRVQVTLHGASRFHVRSAFYAFVRAAKQPKFLAAGVGIYALQIVTAALVAFVGLHSVGEGSTLWGVRILALVTVVAGLWRLAFVVEHGEVKLEREPKPDEAD